MSDDQTRPIPVELTRPLPPVDRPPVHQPQPMPAPGPWPMHAGGVYTQTVAARPVGSVHIAVAWVFAVLSLGYFLPWAIAATRQRSNTAAIGLLNFLVGWTVLGWIAALVMAVSSEPAHVTNVAYAVAPVVQSAPQPPPPAGWYPVQAGGQRYWDGHRWTEHTAP